MTEARKRVWLAALLIVGLLPFELNGWYNPRLSTTAFWCIELLTWVVMPMAILTVALRRGIVTRAELGLHLSVFGKRNEALILMFSLVASFALYHIDRWTVEKAGALFPANFGYSPFQYRTVVPDPGPTTGWLRLLAISYLALSAGWVEETYYRAMMSKLFSPRWWGTLLYVLVSTIVFASAHWEGGVQTMFEAAVFGGIAALLFRAIQNIWPLIIAHTIVDFLWF
jgi:hypothetical protein